MTKLIKKPEMKQLNPNYPKHVEDGQCFRVYGTEIYGRMVDIEFPYQDPPIITLQGNGQKGLNQGRYGIEYLELVPDEMCNYKETHDRE